MSIEFLTKDDEQAIRQASLALFFIFRTHPVEFTTLENLFYKDKPSRDTAYKSFQRDKDVLEQTYALNLKQNRLDRTWHVDKETSFVEDNHLLTKQYSTLLGSFCSTFFNDENFLQLPYLVSALNKLGYSFNKEGELSFDNNVSSLDSVTNSNYNLLKSCFIQKYECTVSYTTANGKVHEYTKLRVYDLLTFQKRNYFVAAAPEFSEPRPLRVDRIRNIKKTGGKNSYQIPEDFKGLDYIKPNFMFGPTVADAVFYIPQQHFLEVKEVSLGKGRFTNAKNGDGHWWKVPISSLEDAVRWSIDLQIQPVYPLELCQQYKQLLLKV